MFFPLVLQNVMNIFASVASYGYLIDDVTVSNRVNLVYPFSVLQATKSWAGPGHGKLGNRKYEMRKWWKRGNSHTALSIDSICPPVGSSSSLLYKEGLLQRMNNEMFTVEPP